MNVLPLVFSFLALITILTYSRLSGFVTSKAIHQEYEQFIKNYQEAVLETAAHKKYVKSGRASDGQSGEASQPKTKIKAHRCLNLHPLLDKEGEKSRETAWIMKNLLIQLFAETKFYKEALSQNSRLLDELIQSMQKAFSALEEKRSFKKGDLSTLELGNPELQYFLYKILKDSPGVENEEDEEVLIAKSATKILNEVITFNKNILPIRVYLADRALLKAIFDNETVVDNIVAARKNYYSLVKKNPDRKEALSDEFRRQFTSFLPPTVQAASMNWDVSGTAPDQSQKTKKET